MPERKSHRSRPQKSETVRERSERAKQPPKPRRLRKTAGKVSGPLRKIIRFGQKEYYLPMPNNKFGRFMNKRRKIVLIPRFLRDSWAEMRKVEWPNGKETWKLTAAVFVFSIVFGILITLVDYGLDKLVRKVIVH